LHSPELPTTIVDLPNVTIELRPNFVPLSLFYQILKKLFWLRAVEGEDHKFEMVVKNRSSIPFDGADLTIEFVIPSVAGPLLAMRRTQRIPRLSAGDMTHLDLGNITMRAAGNGEMTLTLDQYPATQVVFIWYQKQLAGSALVSIGISDRSKVISWVTMLLTFLGVVLAFLTWVSSTS
jgi:hypothetical protein